MLLNTDEQQIYTMYGGRVKVVSGTMIVNIAMNIGYPPFLRLTPVGSRSLYVFSAVRLLNVTYGNKKRIHQKTTSF